MWNKYPPHIWLLALTCLMLMGDAHSDFISTAWLHSLLAAFARMGGNVGWNQHRLDGTVFHYCDNTSTVTFPDVLSQQWQEAFLFVFVLRNCSFKAVSSLAGQTISSERQYSHSWNTDCLGSDASSVSCAESVSGLCGFSELGFAWWCTLFDLHAFLLSS